MLGIDTENFEILKLTEKDGKTAVLFGIECIGTELTVDLL